jgi:guanylate kinase
MRPTEVDGREYHFVTREQFDAERGVAGFLESFEVFGAAYGNLYGTPRRAVDEHLAAGDIVILEIDVQGALAVRAQMPDALLVFIAPPSVETLRARLIGRNDGMSPEQLTARLDTAAAELAQAEQFDAVVVNDDLDRATDEVATLVGRHLGELDPTLTEQ